MITQRRTALWTVLMACAMVALLVPRGVQADTVAAASACAPNQTCGGDSFEGATIDSSWTLIEQNGSVSLTGTQSQAGAQSLQLSATLGGQREIHAKRAFPNATQGRASAWFFDSLIPLYARFVLNHAGTFVAGIYVQDYDLQHFFAAGGGVGGGPTTAPRSFGWHLLEIDTRAGEILVDSTLVLTIPANLEWDELELNLTGPEWRPSGTVFFDEVAWAIDTTCGGKPVTISGSGNIFGTSGDDVILGSDAADIILGGGGADRICAGAGNDRVYGGDGADFLFGGEGNDNLVGGPGDDTLLGEDGGDVLEGGAGRNALAGGEGNDGLDNLIGSAGGELFGEGGRDFILGSFLAADEIGGGSGDDVILSFGGNDRILGHEGRDVIFAGPGDDQVLCGADNDVLDGGAGTDAASDCEIVSNVP